MSETLIHEPVKNRANCDCIEQINAGLLADNARQPVFLDVRRFLNITHGVSYYCLVINTVTMMGARPTNKTVLAAFCPFCGKAYTKVEELIASREEEKDGK